MKNFNVKNRTANHSTAPATERGLHELYRIDAERADALVFGRRVDHNRRGFLKRAGLIGIGGALGGVALPFAANFPGGLIPAALADSTAPFNLAAFGKRGLTILNDRPINAETPPHLLDDAFTPAHYMFVRNNGTPPALADINVDEWTLSVGGEACAHPQTFTLAQLKKRFDQHEYALQIECGGNGRAEYRPPAKGNQWTTGAVSCAKWRGVRLGDVLKSCGIADNAKYIAYYGADKHLSGDPNKQSISRGVPMAKALEKESLIAWAMNGEDINLLNGHPLRVVTAGWPGSTCGKWITRIDIRDRVHDGAKMTGASYRVPRYPVAPGEKVADADMEIIQSMPIKSLITRPQTGARFAPGDVVAMRGHAWGGDVAVDRVHVSIDFGATWRAAKLNSPVNRLAWQRFSAKVKFIDPGYYEIWARATDKNGRAQPMVVPGWNPKGYLNNRCHRVAVYIA